MATMRKFSPSAVGSGWGGGLSSFAPFDGSDDEGFTSDSSTDASRRRRWTSGLPRSRRPAARAGVDPSNVYRLAAEVAQLFHEHGVDAVMGVVPAKAAREMASRMSVGGDRPGMPSWMTSGNGPMWIAAAVVFAILLDSLYKRRRSE